MPELQLVRVDHGPAILAFELANRAYFAESISDRGDDYFQRFHERHNELLAEQNPGISASYVLVDEDGSVLGRFNLYRLEDGTAEIRLPGCATGSRPQGNDRGGPGTLQAGGVPARAANAQGSDQ